MAWNWTSYTARMTKAVKRSPASCAFGSAYFAFVGGLDMRNLKHGMGLERFGILIFPVAALLMSYFLARTIRELRDHQGQS